MKFDIPRIASITTIISPMIRKRDNNISSKELSPGVFSIAGVSIKVGEIVLVITGGVTVDLTSGF